MQRHPRGGHGRDRNLGRLSNSGCDRGGQRQLEARLDGLRPRHVALQRERVAEAGHRGLGGDAPLVRAGDALPREPLEHEHVAQLLAIERAGRDLLAVESSHRRDLGCSRAAASGTARAPPACRRGSRGRRPAVALGCTRPSSAACRSAADGRRLCIALERQRRERRGLGAAGYRAVGAQDALADGEPLAAVVSRDGVAHALAQLVGAWPLHGSAREDRRGGVAVEPARGCARTRRGANRAAVRALRPLGGPGGDRARALGGGDQQRCSVQPSPPWNVPSGRWSWQDWAARSPSRESTGFCGCASAASANGVAAGASGGAACRSARCRRRSLVFRSTRDGRASPSCSAMTRRGRRAAEPYASAAGRSGAAETSSLRSSASAPGNTVSRTGWCRTASAEGNSTQRRGAASVPPRLAETGRPAGTTRSAWTSASELPKRARTPRAGARSARISVRTRCPAPGPRRPREADLPPGGALGLEGERAADGARRWCSRLWIGSRSSSPATRKPGSTGST